MKGEPVRFINGHQTRGRKLSAEHVRKVSEALRGRPVSAETKAKISVANRGRRHTAEARRRIAEAVSGKQRTGARHHNWKGDAVGYFGLHSWVARHKKKTGVCTSCAAVVGTACHTGTEWANVSGRYLRDLDDFVELCIPCHRARDHAAQIARAASRARDNSENSASSEPAKA